MHDMVDPEAGPARQELHATHPHELHGDHAGKRTESRADQARKWDEQSVHAVTVARAPD